MKTTKAMYSIICKDKLDAPAEESGVLYADDMQWAYVHELAYTLSILNPSRLVVIMSYAYTQTGMVDTAYLAGEEICIDDCGFMMIIPLEEIIGEPKEGSILIEQEDGKYICTPFEEDRRRDENFDLAESLFE